MRSLLLTAASLLLFGVCAYIAGQPRDVSVKVRLQLTDAVTKKPVSGFVRVFADKKDQPLRLPELYDRFTGLKPKGTAGGWHIVPAAGADVLLPRSAVRLEAFRGLETALAKETLDLGGNPPQEITLPLRFLFTPGKEGVVAGNTHLHLRNLTRAQADEYLAKIPEADGLEVMFISYLERDKDDKTYITNQYPVGDLKGLKTKGVLFNNGEEHRHNFAAYGQGYGHVMFLGLQKLVQPVSLGPGITGIGNDDRILQPGIEEARKQGATVIWCHNGLGHEDVPNVLAGRLDALNVFDGSRTGTYAEAYYRYLNIGLRLPLSTGTDWFMYDFSRVYAGVKGVLSVRSWLDAVKAGRTVATNGPLLRLTVAGKSLGEVVKLDKETTVTVQAEGVGRHKFATLQLVQNGKVVQEVRPKEKDGGYLARLERNVRITDPAWFAVRIAGEVRDEFDGVLFAHSSPCYVDYQGQGVFDVEEARALLKQLEEAKADIHSKGRFSTPEARNKVLAVYAEAEKNLTTRLNQRR